MPLLACPFCREMYEASERKTCPVCGVALAPFHELPASYEAQEDDEPLDAIDEPSPLTDFARGRVALAAIGVVGLVLFFLPWMHLTLPDISDRSGYQLARRIGWPWGAEVAWMILVPTVLSRRTIRQLRGARVAAAFLSAFPGMTAAILLVQVPHNPLVPLQFTYGWPIEATLVASVIAIALSLRLGGRVDDIAVRHGSSAGQMLH